MLKDASAPLSGNNRFEGYGIDLIHKLSVMLGFNYTFVVQEDGNYGNLDQKTGEWNGMVRELMDYVRIPGDIIIFHVVSNNLLFSESRFGDNRFNNHLRKRKCC